MSTISRTYGGTDLLDRQDALGALHGAYSEVKAGAGRLVLVAGEAGIGKTTLVQSFCDSVRPSGLVLRGACDPLFAPRPLGPFADLAPEAGDAFNDVVTRGVSPSDVFAALRDELSSGSTILVLEDLHWADEATLDVLRLLARRAESIPALVVATYRDDGLDRTHPLRVVLGELSGMTGVETVHLGPLSAGAVAEWAESYGADAGRGVPPHVG